MAITCEHCRGEGVVGFGTPCPYCCAGTLYERPEVAAAEPAAQPAPNLRRLLTAAFLEGASVQRSGIGPIEIAADLYTQEPLSEELRAALRVDPKAETPARHAPITMPVERAHMIEKAIRADEPRNWHSIVGPNGMCECGVQADGTVVMCGSLLAAERQGVAPPPDVLIAFIEGERDKALRAVAAREDAAQGWETGTDKDHDEARRMAERQSGRKMPKMSRQDRENTAAMQRRIAVKEQQEADHYEAILTLLRACGAATPTSADLPTDVDTLRRLRDRVDAALDEKYTHKVVEPPVPVIETREVLAAYYLGPNKGHTRMLSHACEVADDGRVTKVLCGRVSNLSMADKYAGDTKAVPTCEYCQRKLWARGAAERSPAATVRYVQPRTPSERELEPEIHERFPSPPSAGSEASKT